MCFTQELQECYKILQRAQKCSNIIILGIQKSFDTSHKIKDSGSFCTRNQQESLICPKQINSVPLSSSHIQTNLFKNITVSF